MLTVFQSDSAIRLCPVGFPDCISMTSEMSDQVGTTELRVVVLGIAEFWCSTEAT